MDHGTLKRIAKIRADLEDLRREQTALAVWYVAQGGSARDLAEAMGTTTQTLYARGLFAERAKGRPPKDTWKCSRCGGRFLKPAQSGRVCKPCRAEYDRERKAKCSQGDCSAAQRPGDVIEPQPSQ